MEGDAMFSVKSIDIRGHWRSGRFWPNAVTEVSADEVTKAMLADPRLRIDLIGDRVQAVVDEVLPRPANKKVAKPRSSKKNKP
jgi:hypothetical protein